MSRKKNSCLTTVQPITTCLCVKFSLEKLAAGWRKLTHGSYFVHDMFWHVVLTFSIKAPRQVPASPGVIERCSEKKVLFVHIKILPSSVISVFLAAETLFGSIQLFPWEQTRRNLWSHQEPELLQMFANAACGCWAPAGTHPSNDPVMNIYQRWLSGEAGITGLTHWTYLARGRPACHCGLGSPSVRPSPPPPKLEAQRELTFNRSVLLVYTSRDRVFSLLRRDVSGISISIYQWRGAEVYLYRGIVNRFQKWWFLIVKKFWFVPEFKGLYGKELFLHSSSQIIIFSTFGIMKIRYNFF